MADSKRKKQQDADYSLHPQISPHIIRPILTEQSYLMLLRKSNFIASNSNCSPNVAVSYSQRTFLTLDSSHTSPKLIK